MSTPSVSAPTFEHHHEALGIGEPTPRISFVVSAEAGWTQRAYELEVRTSREITSTGQIATAESVLVPWPRDPLASRESASVRVRVWGTDGNPSPWSEWSQVETGLLLP